MKRQLMWVITWCAVSALNLSGEGREITKKKSEDKVILCRTSLCNENAKKLLESIDASVDPCDNFYQHTCGKWQREHLLPVNETGITEYWELEKKVIKAIIGLLEDGNNGSTPSEMKLRQLYSQCMDDEEREKLQAGPLLDLLEYTMGGWPILKPDWDPSKFNTADVLLNSFLAGSEPFFVIEIIANITNPRLPEIFVKEPETFAKSYILNDDVLGELYAESYKKYMLDVTALLLQGSHSPFGVTTFSSNLTEIFNMERNISLTRMPIPTRNAPIISHRYSLSELKALRYFKSTLLRNSSKSFYAYAAAANVSHTLYDNITVAVVNLPLLLELDLLLIELEQQGEEGAKRLANYLGWHIIKTHIRKLSKNYFDVSSAYTAKLGGVPGRPEYSLAVRCFTQLKQSMPLALGALYVQKKIPADLRKKALVVAKNVQRGFAELLDEATWLEKSTYRAALNKLSNVILDVGYPEALVANTTLFDRFYGDIAIEDTYMKSMLNVVRSAKLRNLGRLAMPYVRDEPLGTKEADITTPGAHYEPERNRLVIHAAMLHPPFFDPDGPHYASYAGLGVDAGHEITHAFDRQGSRYDQHGVWRNWWNDSSRGAFSDRLNSMARRYDSYMTEFGWVNGELTNNENVADIGGHRAAYKAYTRHLQQSTSPERIPLHLKHYSPQQLFFLSAGTKMCRKLRPQLDRLLLLDDPHSPAEWRVNGVMSNMAEFAQAFNCSSSSRMNPTVKRIVW